MDQVSEDLVPNIENSTDSEVNWEVPSAERLLTLIRFTLGETFTQTATETSGYAQILNSDDPRMNEAKKAHARDGIAKAGYKLAKQVNSLETAIDLATMGKPIPTKTHTKETEIIVLDKVPPAKYQENSAIINGSISEHR